MEAAVRLGIRYHAGRGTNTLPRSQGSTIPDEIVVAPCRLINGYIETFKESIVLVRSKGVRLHTHLGEGENVIMQERWQKRTGNGVGYKIPNFNRIGNILLISGVQWFFGINIALLISKQP